MLHTQKTFIYKTLHFHYHQFGAGKSIFIAFHGFGQTGLVFRGLAEAIGEECTLYSFDLPFHGKSYWGSGELPLEKDFWKELMQSFIEEKKTNKFSIVGFSLGAKFALATVEMFPEKIEEAVLVAPDGIKTNFWYRLATYPRVLRKYFRRLIIYPTSFFKMINFINKLKLMDKGVLRFAAGQMDTVRKRRKVYYSWVVLRKMKFNLKSLAKILNHHDIPIKIYIGTFDKIITVSNLQKFLRMLNNHELKLIRTGHNSLLQKVITDLKNNNLCKKS